MRKFAEKERESLVDHYCPPAEDLEVSPAEHHGCMAGERTFNINKMAAPVWKVIN